MSDRAITQLSNARLALAECKTVMEAKGIADAAEAARVYLERTKASVDTVNEASEVRLMAEKQMGEFLKVTPKQDGGDAMKARSLPGTEVPPTLSDMGITKKESARAQKLASLPRKELHRRIEAGKAAGKLTIAAVMNPPEEVVYPRPAHQNAPPLCNGEALGVSATKSSEETWRSWSPQTGGGQRGQEMMCAFWWGSCETNSPTQ